MDILYSNFNTDKNSRVSHSHTFCELIYVCKGEATFSFGSINTKVHEKQIILITAFEHHSVEITKSPYERYCINLSAESAVKLINNPEISCVFSSRKKNAFYIFDVRENFCLIEALFENINHIFAKSHKYNDYELRSNLQSLFYTIYRFQPDIFYKTFTNNPEMQKVMDYINTHYTDDIKISELANQAYISSAHLSHMFKNYSGYSPKQYLTLCRITRAKEILREGNESIHFITTHCGFSDENNFIRLFKSKEGVTPGEYRKKFNKNE